MAQVKLVQDKDASADVRAVFDDIRRGRKTDYVTNIWRALAGQARRDFNRKFLVRSKIAQAHVNVVIDGTRLRFLLICNCHLPILDLQVRQADLFR